MKKRLIAVALMLTSALVATPAHAASAGKTVTSRPSWCDLTWSQMSPGQRATYLSGLAISPLGTTLYIIYQCG